MKLLSLDKDYSIKLSSNVVDYIYPDYIFIPILDGYKLLVKNNEEVKKEQALLENKDGYFLYSSVSGKVVGAKECMLASGIRQKCLVIENDFKEKLVNRTSMRKNLLNIPRTEFLNKLKEKAILSSKTNDLLVNIFNKDNFRNILVLGFETEPYLASNIFSLKNYSSEILETLSFLARIFRTEKNLIILKNNDRDNVESYTNVLGTYPEININVIPDLYPIELDDILCKYIGVLKNETLFITVSDILAIYKLMKKNKLITEKLITITGNAIENPIVVKTKIGASFKNILEEHIKFINEEGVVYIANGLLRGCEVDIDNLIITDKLEGIIINYKCESLEHECISCGKCFEVCPVNINPYEIFCKGKCNEDDNCINCGLCTYICPSYINFKKRIKELKDEK